jgi:hypothetical protein
MSRKRYKPEQIILMLREADAQLSQGQGLGQVCRGLGIAVSTVSVAVERGERLANQEELQLSALINVKYEGRYILKHQRIIYPQWHTIKVTIHLPKKETSCPQTFFLPGPHSALDTPMCGCIICKGRRRDVPSSSLLASLRPLLPWKG